MGERFIPTDENGQLLNANLGDYLLPRATDMPPIEIGHLNTPSPLNPMGSKGVGEAGAPWGYQSGKGFFIQVWTIASRWRARSSLEAGIVLTRFSSGLNSCATTMTTAEGTRR